MMVTKNSITVNFEGKTYTVSSDNGVYAKVLDAYKRRDEQAIKNLMDIRSRLVTSLKETNEDVSVVDGVVFLDGKEVYGELSGKMMMFINEGLPMGPLMAFCRKLRKNPSNRALRDLFSFLEKNNHPITESGNFLAYKKVHEPDSQGRMLDIHSKTFDNRPGNVLEMPRNEVDEDPNRTCSHGLHVANWDYAQQFGTGVMLEVEVDPADVVAIPVDYNQSKMRVCRYKVRCIVENPNESNGLVRDSKPAASGSTSNVSSSSNSSSGSKAQPFEVEELDEEDQCEYCGEEVGWCDCDEEDDEETCDDCGVADSRCECYSPAPTTSQTSTPVKTTKQVSTQPTKSAPAPAVKTLKVTLHSAKDIAKMSTERLERYIQRLEEEYCSATQPTMELVQRIYKQRIR